MLNPNSQIPQNIPYSNVNKFVGREESLVQLHQLLHQNEGTPKKSQAPYLSREDNPKSKIQNPKSSDQVAIAAISGIGGVGKTELAIQYATQHLEDYPGGVCWLYANTGDVGLQLLEFARQSFFPDINFDGVSLSEKLAYCWDNWVDGTALIVMDDVTTSYQDLELYLPPQSSRFKVLMTTRLEGLAPQQLSLDVLTISAALELLASWIGEYRVKATKGKGFALTPTQQPIAQQLCDWLGYLPLAIELVGRYLKQDPGLSLEKMLERLKKQKLSHQSLSEDENVNAQRGVKAAFELCWKRLDRDTQELACLLSIFALAPIPWEQVESVLGQQYLPGAMLGKLMEGKDAEADIEALIERLQQEWEKQRSALVQLHLLQRIDEGTYSLHQLSREFLRQKLEKLEQAEGLKQTFCEVMVAVAKQIPQELTIELIEAITPAIPHIAETAIALQDFLNDKDLIKPFIGLGNFYKCQGFYKQVEFWFKECLFLTQNRLDEENVDILQSLNNLAEIYSFQSRCSEAEPLLIETLEICERHFGVNHPHTITAHENLERLRQITRDKD